MYLELKMFICIWLTLNKIKKNYFTLPIFLHTLRKTENLQTIIAYRNSYWAVENGHLYLNPKYNLENAEKKDQSQIKACF